MENENDFMAAFDDKPATVEQPAAQPAEASAPAQPVIVKPETVPAPVGSAPAQPVEVKPPATPNFVTREELAAQERARKAEEERDALLAQQEQPEVPDPVKDPVGYQQYERSARNMEIINERLNMSEIFARDKYGDERIDTVQNWFLERSKTDPLLFQRVMQSRNPYGIAIKEFDNEQLLKNFSDPKELESYNEWKKTRAAGGSPPAPNGGPVVQPTVASPAVVQPPAIQQPVVPRSIADAPSAGKDGINAIPTGPGQAFDSAFVH